MKWFVRAYLLASLFVFVGVYLVTALFYVLATETGQYVYPIYTNLSGENGIELGLLLFCLPGVLTTFWFAAERLLKGRV